MSPFLCPEIEARGHSLHDWQKGQLINPPKNLGFVSFFLGYQLLHEFIYSAHSLLTQALIHAHVYWALVG